MSLRIFLSASLLLLYRPCLICICLIIGIYIHMYIPSCSVRVSVLDFLDILEAIDTSICRLNFSFYLLCNIVLYGDYCSEVLTSFYSWKKYLLYFVCSSTFFLRSLLVCISFPLCLQFAKYSFYTAVMITMFPTGSMIHAYPVVLPHLVSGVWFWFRLLLLPFPWLCCFLF